MAQRVVLERRLTWQTRHHRVTVDRWRSTPLFLRNLMRLPNLRVLAVLTASLFAVGLSGRGNDISSDEVSEDEDAVDVTYNTTTDTAMQPALTLSLKNIPTGTFEGTLVGTFQMTGDLKGDVTLNLTMSGQLEEDGTGKVRHKAGTTTVTGTAKSGEGGEYQVNVTL